mmetsp:Transcript_7743/g.11725  ORF Transcript_7743/g.11725 Transcript_7743/m.11725 type:complete len:125 (-) Transcript_7743:782-1156(-)
MAAYDVPRCFCDASFTMYIKLCKQYVWAASQYSSPSLFEKAMWQSIVSTPEVIMTKRMSDDMHRVVDSTFRVSSFPRKSTNNEVRLEKSIPSVFDTAVLLDFGPLNNVSDRKMNRSVAACSGFT